MNGQKKARGGRIMIRYLVSYLLLLTLPLIFSFVLYRNGFNRLVDEIKTVNHSAVESVCAALEQQIGLMDDYSQRVYGSAAYSLYMMEKTGYNRYQLVQQLKLLNATLPETMRYGLWDFDDGKIFAADGTYTADVYCGNFLCLDDPTAFSAVLRAAPSPRLMHWTNDADERLLVYLYPISFLSHSMETYGGCMFFALNEEETLAAFSRQKKAEGQLTLTLDTAQPSENTDDVYYARSQEYGFEMCLSLGEGTMLANVHKNMRMFTVSFYVTVALSVLMSIWMSYTNIRPILRMLSSLIPYERSRREAPQNELDRINSIIDNVLDENRMIFDRLSVQDDLLRQQNLTLLLNGHNSPAMWEELERLGLHRQTPGAFVVLMTGTPPVGGKETDRMLMATSAFVPPAGLQMHWLELDAFHVVAAIVCADSAEDRREEVAEALVRYGESLGYAWRLNVGLLCRSLSEINASLGVALSLGVDAERPGDAVLFPQGAQGRSAVWQARTSKAVMCLKQAVQCGNAALLPGYIADALEEIRQQTDGAVSLRCAYYDLLNEMIALHTEEHAAFPCAEIEKEIISLRADRLEQLFAQALSGIAQTMEKNAASAEEKCAEELVVYVRNNCMDVSLCLDQLIDRFGVSANKIGHIMRAKTGYGFREYLIYQRMIHAQELLLQSDATISAVCAACGYNNSSYFIKTFKEYFGMTPAQYRKQMRSGGAEHG